MSAPDVVYVHPAKHAVNVSFESGTPARSPYMAMPVGMTGLGNLLRENGHTTVGLNYPLELLVNARFSLEQELSDLAGARLVMIDLHWYEHSFGAIDVARAARAALPDARIVLGGLTASAFAREILKGFPEVDYVIRGDAEEPLLRLVTSLKEAGEKPDLSAVPNLTFRSGDRIVENERTYCAASADLEKLNCVDLAFLAHHKEYRRTQYVGTGLKNTSDPFGNQGQWVPTGRGCRFNCSYCGGSASAHKALAGRQGIVTRPPARVAHELDLLSRQGVHQVSLTLDPAILGESYWSALFEQMASSRVRIGLYNEHFQLPSKEFIRAFARVADLRHSQLAITPLVGSEKVRRLNGKLYSNQELLDTLGELKQHAVPIFVFFSLNLPGEDPKSFEKTLELASRLADAYPAHLLYMINQCHTVDPVSPMSTRPEQFGIGVSLRSFKDYYEYCQQTPRAQLEARVGDLRGFSSGGRSRLALEGMAAKWAEFCQTHRGQAFPIPRNW